MKPVSATAQVAFEEAMCMAAMGARAFALQVPPDMSAAEALRQFADKLWPPETPPAQNVLPFRSVDTHDTGRVRICAARSGGWELE